MKQTLPKGKRPRRPAQKSRMPYGRGTGVPHPIDAHVGGRIRARRLYLGINQEKLANALGLTFQQVQKYEAGTNRVSASRLSETAKVLDVPVSYFFADLPAQGEAISSEKQAFRDIMSRTETIDLVRLYYGISDPKVRQHFLELVLGIAGQSEAEG